ncbi:MAG: Short chain dehydrogenase [Marmoricola sp.]|nr:Short chain dehydrogenase [Marmoricola sp.]
MLTLKYSRALPTMRVNAADPGYTRTDLNAGNGEHDVTEVTDEIVRLATVSGDGPTGTISNNYGASAGKARPPRDHIRVLLAPGRSRSDRRLRLGRISCHGGRLTGGSDFDKHHHSVDPDVARATCGEQTRLDTRGQRARASADLLEQVHDDPFGTTHIGHPHAVLVLADAADEPVPVRSHRIDGRLKVADLEGHVAQA